MNEPGIEEQGENSPEPVELTAQDLFTSTRRNAQRQASTNGASRKRAHLPQHHSMSARTIRRHKKAKKDREAQGFLPLSEFLKWKAMSTARPNARQQDTQKNDMRKAEEMGTACSAEGGSVSTPVLVVEEEEEEEEAGETVLHPIRVEDNDNETEVTSIAPEEEEEEEEDEVAAAVDSKSEDEKSTTSQDESSSNSWRWGRSQRILCESEESSQCLSLSSDGNTTLSDLEEVFGIDPKEVEGLHDGNSPDDSATQQPASNAADFL